MNINKNISGPQSGYVAGTRAYKQRWDSEIAIPDASIWLVADASTPSPNFRASEMFLHLALALQFPEMLHLGFLGHGGTLQEYKAFWNNVGVFPDDDWRVFYSVMRNIDKISPLYAPAGLMEDIPYERETLLWLAFTALGISWTDNIQVMSLEDIAHMPLSQVPWNGDPMVGKIPCPDCSHQRGEVVYHPVRREKGEYYLCKNERSTKAVGCKGAKAWQESKAWEIPIPKLVELTGMRMSGKLIYKLFAMSAYADESALLVRDYSRSRGTVETIVNQWPTKQLAITTALYIKTQDGEDADALELIKAFEDSPSDWAPLLLEFPIFSNGEIWEITI